MCVKEVEVGGAGKVKWGGCGVRACKVCTPVRAHERGGRVGWWCVAIVLLER